MADRTGVTNVAIARSVRAAALSVPGVVALQGGSVGEYATRGPHDRVFGVRIQRRPDRVGVRVVALFGHPLPELGDAVHAAISTGLSAVGMGPESVVRVRIVDVVSSEAASS